MLRTLSGVLMLLTFATRSARAQEPAAGPDPIGVREPARVADEFPRLSPTGFAATPKANQLFLVPTYQTAEGVSIYGGTLGYINRTLLPNNVPLQFRLSDKLIDQGAQNRNRISVDAKISLAPSTSKWKAAVGALYLNTADVSNRGDFSLALETPISKCEANCISLGVTGSIVRLSPKVGDAKNGGVVAPGATFKLGNTTELGADYRFKSDVLGEEDFSFAVRQSLSTLDTKPTLALAAGRHRSVALNMFIYF